MNSNKNLIQLHECLIIKQQDFTTWKQLITSEKVKKHITNYGILKIRFELEGNLNSAGKKRDYYENWLKTTKASAYVKKAYLQQNNVGVFTDYLKSKNNKTKISKFVNEANNNKFNQIDIKSLNLEQIRGYFF
jgi:hypothetical protein